MTIDAIWLLLIIPAAFALGWLASRLDQLQNQKDQHEMIKPYYRGLYLLLSEQHDQAIDAFIQATQNDINSHDLHFALGNLLRKRGEFERAVRVHEHLLQRPGLAHDLRLKAQYELAQDFMRAGLLDRAESAYQALDGSSYTSDALLALLHLYERAREWNKASDVALRLQNMAAGSFTERLAHHACEVAEETQEPAAQKHALEQALNHKSSSARPAFELARWYGRQGFHALALQTSLQLLPHHPGAFSALAQQALHWADTPDQKLQLQRALQRLYETSAQADTLLALNQLESDDEQALVRTQTHFLRTPDIYGLQALMHWPTQQWGNDCIENARRLIERQARPIYGCVACGFSGQRHFWQCPGCGEWDSIPLQQ